MKKSVMIVLTVGLIAAVSLGAYAHGGGRGNYSGPMMGGNYGPGMMMNDRGVRGGNGYCGAYDSTQREWSGRNAPNRTGAAPELVTEDKVKENAETYISKYLPGYTIEKIEKDEWRPMYSVTLKSENGAEQQMWVRGFDGQVMHVIPKTAE